MRGLVLMIGLLVVAAGPLAAQERAVRRLLADATVRLASGCTGAIAERSQLIVTAYHCVTDRVSVGARLATGEERTAWVVATDQVADQAVLFLEESSEVTPLRITRRHEIPGAVLYFAGHPDRVAFQSARLDRIGVCPSLPGLPNALFTSITGTPGDSGAALVNAAGDLVGLVHGGARCEIATPADTLLALVQRVLRPAPAPHVERASIRLGVGVGPSPGPQAARAGVRGVVVQARAVMAVARAEFVLRGGGRRLGLVSRDQAKPLGGGDPECPIGARERLTGGVRCARGHGGRELHRIVSAEPVTRCQVERPDRLVPRLVSCQARCRAAGRRTIVRTNGGCSDAGPAPLPRCQGR